MAENPTYTTCPRCGQETLRTDRPVMNALSRTDNKTYVCSPCGTDEAMENFLGGEPQPWYNADKTDTLLRDESND
jgi:predicted RNA-binding Zn-ribbon protein involved in translation (DUF1610 family)